MARISGLRMLTAITYLRQSRFINIDHGGYAPTGDVSVDTVYR